MIELYHCQDARSFRCLWALEELAVPYTLHVMAFPPRATTPDYLSKNPTGTVPLLMDGEVRVAESAAALEYLATKYGAATLGVSPDDDDYGDWLTWTHYGEATLTAPLAIALRYGAFASEAKRLPDVVEDLCGLFLDRLGVVEARLAEQDFLSAGRFTTADISVAYALLLSRFLGIEQRLPPATGACWQRLQERPAYSAARKAQKAHAPAA
jgi:glutathione S-transferase